MSAYRYRLTRPGTSKSRRLLVWIMLNPSTADDTTDDPTIRRVTRFTADNGYGPFHVVNLFARRATNPAHLLDCDDPVGPDNENALLYAVGHADGVVCAWGAWIGNQTRIRRTRMETLMPDIERIMLARSVEPMCLGTTQGGFPRHPLYVPADQPLEPFDINDMNRVTG